MHRVSCTLLLMLLLRVVGLSSATHLSPIRFTTGPSLCKRKALLASVGQPRGPPHAAPPAAGFSALEHSSHFR
ncbi:hypothetical protein SNOG_12034 [Parastagonospora nodorum SN15]|uniref:Secreted protein n=1 Tax=Phaeosphaeria nodorum (strain SN15 / ATCC MYA-4574 / FGSC 10173) TaxID=321614 RepID=Q0U880_PHANO|nr:hypothetical protein SNOG_12034 [Parastagonospora nodorum SN15]EAT80446.1 hypothetical protein SNOG_12034 [Parastagonospora nodorum SN15]